MSQIVGTLVGISIAFVGGLIVYGVIRSLVGLRLNEEEEFNGADFNHKIKANPEVN